MTWMRPNVRDQPRAARPILSGLRDLHAPLDGCIPLLGRRLASAQLEHGRLALSIESDDSLVMAPQQLRNLVSRAVAKLNPYKFWRRSAQNRKPMEVSVLTHEEAPMRPRQLPNRGVPSAAMTEQSNVRRIREDIAQRLA